MTADDLPTPLVPADVDLRDFSFIPLEINRLLKSKAWREAKRQPELGFYMLNLWVSSWHEVPAASLEDDDDLLCETALCDPKKWVKIREKIMRGWVKCSDGRLYHPVVAEKALDAWERKLSQRERTKKATETRKAKKINGDAERDVNTDGQRDGALQRDRSGDVTFTKGQGQGQREEEKKPSPPPPSLSPAAPEAGPIPPGGGVGGGQVSLPTDPPPPTDHRALAKRANEVRLRLLEIVGTDENRHRAWAKLSAISGWLEFGCDPDLDIYPTVEAEVARRNQRGQGPIGSPDYLTEPVKRAKADRARTATEQPADNGRRAPEPSREAPDAEGDQWRSRLKGLRDRGLWLDSWGPLPGHKRCRVPGGVQVEFGFDDPAKLQALLARHREAA